MGAKRTRLTNRKIKKLEADNSKKDQIHWDSEAAGLGVRVQGSKATFIFQFRFAGRSARMSIGSVDAWDIDDSRVEARRLRTLVDQGKDPRDLKQNLISKVNTRVLFKEAWFQYVESRKRYWSEAHWQDHMAAIQSPGLPRKRSKKLTVAGGLYEFLDCTFQEITISRLEDWLKRENITRPVVTTRNYRLLKAFLNWAAEQEGFAELVPSGVVSSKRVSQLVCKPSARSDLLQREQLRSWFKEVRAIDNPIVSALVQVLLLTGARKSEILQLKWDDVDFRWKSLTIRDKASSHGGLNGQRVIPMTPYVEKLIVDLPRQNEWVFSSNRSASGRLIDPRVQYSRALEKAELIGITIHGLRRSFGTLSEWIEAPAGVIAQIMGHKPSAIAEKHYRVRSLGLLRMWHERIERWMLDEANVGSQ